MDDNSRTVSHSPYDNYHDNAEHININGRNGSVPSNMDYERPQPTVETEETPTNIDNVLGRISIPQSGSKVGGNRKENIS